MLKRIFVLLVLFLGVAFTCNLDKCFAWGVYGNWGQTYYGLYGSLFKLQYNHSTYNQYHYKVFYYNGTDTQHVVTDADLSAGGWTRDSYAQNVANKFSTYNNWHLGVTFVYDGQTTTTIRDNGGDTYDIYGNQGQTGYRGSVAIYKNLHGGAGLAAPLSQSWFGMKLALNTSNPHHDVNHEMGHCMGFGHCFDQQGGGYGNMSMWYAPVVRGIESVGAMEDAISGMWISQKNPNTGDYAKITGNIHSDYPGFYNTGWADAYLVNSVSKKVWYQSMIDRNGYFEFRAKKIPSNGQFWLMVVSPNANYSQAYPYVKGTGTNPQVYYCTQSHTASSSNRPTSGTNWQSYWTLSNDNAYGAGWSSGRNYTTRQGSGIISWTTVGLPTVNLGSSFNVANVTPSLTSISLKNLQNDSGVQILYSEL